MSSIHSELFGGHYEKQNGCLVNLSLLNTFIYSEKLSLEVREVSKNVTKTLPNIANPHIGIYREIGQQVLASIEDGHTDTQTDTQTDRRH